MNIDQLEKIALAAEEWSETIGEHSWYETRELVKLGARDIGRYKDVEMIDEADAAHIAAFDPPTALKLLAVVRAAQAFQEAESHANWQESQALSNALRELEPKS